jgi:hypothetical protein
VKLTLSILFALCLAAQAKAQPFPDTATAHAQAAKIKAQFLAMQAAKTNSPAVVVVPVLPGPRTVATLCWHMEAQAYRDVKWTNDADDYVLTLTYPMTNQIQMRWLRCTNLNTGPFLPVPGAWPLDGKPHTMHDTNAISTAPTQYFYRAIAELPITPTITVTNQ